MTKNKRDMYRELGGGFIPRERLKEDADAEGIDLEKAENEHFEEED